MYNSLQWRQKLKGIKMRKTSLKHMKLGWFYYYFVKLVVVIFTQVIQYHIINIIYSIIIRVIKIIIIKDKTWLIIILNNL